MRTKHLGLLALGGAPLLLSCFSSHPISELRGLSSDGQPLGSFAVSSQALGDQTFTPTLCKAGARQFFLGADLTSEPPSLVLRLVVDPLEGPAVRLFRPEAQFDKTVVFHRSDCAVFHFSLDSTGWRINEIEDYTITLQLDCSRTGEKLSGTASSTHCH